jgi:hypothetical protein
MRKSHPRRTRTTVDASTPILYPTVPIQKGHMARPKGPNDPTTGSGNAARFGLARPRPRALALVLAGMVRLWVARIDDRAPEARR